MRSPSPRASLWRKVHDFFTAARHPAPRKRRLHVETLENRVALTAVAVNPVLLPNLPPAAPVTATTTAGNVGVFVNLAGSANAVSAPTNFIAFQTTQQPPVPIIAAFVNYASGNGEANAAAHDLDGDEACWPWLGTEAAAVAPDSKPEACVVETARAPADFTRAVEGLNTADLHRRLWQEELTAPAAEAVSMQEPVTTPTPTETQPESAIGDQVWAGVGLLALVPLLGWSRDEKRSRLISI